MAQVVYHLQLNTRLAIICIKKCACTIASVSTMKEVMLFVSWHLYISFTFTARFLIPFLSNTSVPLHVDMHAVLQLNKIVGFLIMLLV